MGRLRAFWRDYSCAVGNVRDRGFSFYGRSWHPVYSRWAIAKHWFFHDVLSEYLALIGYRASDAVLKRLGYRQDHDLPQYWWYRDSDFALIRYEDTAAYRSRTTYFRRSDNQIGGNARSLPHLLWITWRYARRTATALR